MQKLVILSSFLLLTSLACGLFGGEEESADTAVQAIATNTPAVAAFSAATNTPAPTATPQPTVALQPQANNTSPLPTPVLQTEVGQSSPLPTPSQSGAVVQSEIDNLVAQAKALLVGQAEIRVATDQISLKSIQEHDWPDSSLGCPEADKGYTQVITPGYIVILEAEGKTYEFHTDQFTQVVPCFDLVTPQDEDANSSLNESISLPDGAVIDYRREGGFAGVSEGWVIYADGRITDLAGGVWQTPPELVTELLTTIETNRFFEMAPTYIPQDTCCDRFKHQLTVLKDGLAHTVVTLDDAPTAPPELADILDEVGDFLLAEQDR